jgi:Rrf2 family protein
MLFSAATGYALQALSRLPQDGSYMLVRELAEKLDLPGPFLAKVLQQLAQMGLLESAKGPKGGFRLARPADQICVGEVVAALEGPGALDHCVMGFSSCESTNPCPLHEAWSAVKAQVEASMTQSTLAALQKVAQTRPAPILPPKSTRKR